MNQKIIKVGNQKGFTFIEVLISLAIGAILLLIVSGSFFTATKREALDKQAVIVLSLLEQARNQTLSAKGALAYGVHFEQTKAVLFSGQTYSGTNSTNITEPLTSLVKISSIALSGGGSEVVFERLTGETAENGTITLSLSSDANQKKIITVSATGIAQIN